jgi:hypothetical protein
MNSATPNVGGCLMATRIYARILSVGLPKEINDLLDAAVEYSDMPISTYVRRALRAQFERDGLLAPRVPPKPLRPQRGQRSSHAQAVI